MTKSNQTTRRLVKYITEERKHLNHSLETDNYNRLNTSLNSIQFQYAIQLLQIGSTILFYNEKYILQSSRDEGKYNKLNIWDYLCKMNSEDRILNSHRQKLGFPVDNAGYPTVSSRQLQKILSGESINKNSQQFVQNLYCNKQFVEVLSEWQNSPLTEGRVTKKNMNKLKDILEHLEYNNVFPILDKKLQDELKKIKDFTEWRLRNNDIWNQLVNELH